MLPMSLIVYSITGCLHHYVDNYYTFKNCADYSLWELIFLILSYAKKECNIQKNLDIYRVPIYNCKYRQSIYFKFMLPF